ncbi:aminoglycoside phosphotransferase family protein [uncultured Mucilaginibacter sp.]|uniref:phosphotransferase enzyme family protein n=1 Tax=uncultured Mucilaginibacter sp. TaxID=797541 RepID=UPI0025ED899C|nr:aminoglycoside phosphotransferase family protein [uncultured Mucilaginibacter sp.]
MFDNILISFGLNPSDYTIQPFGSGLINHTLKVSGNAGDFILQQINVNVFKSPEDIAENLSLLNKHFKKTKSDYLFVAPLPAISGDFLVKSASGNVFRLFPFVKGSQTINFISYEKEAFEAAKQFGKFTRLLNEFEIGQLKYILPDFHNLTLRFQQFKTAHQNAPGERLDPASNEIKEVYKHDYILQTYKRLIANNEIPLRVIHHDTKISNILFDEQQNGLCVIDLDTVMPGYYLSDVGDMMRTYLSPANEEEADLSKIHIRENFFYAICKGYLSEMGTVLSETEKKYFIFSGELMIYMQAIRFLTDFLNNDIYYGTKYPGHNLNRARNQFTLLNKYVEAEEKFRQMMIEAERDLSTVPDF